MARRKRRIDVMPPSDQNLDGLVELLESYARGLVPAHYDEFPIGIYSADPDGHTRAGGSDMGDGPILWHIVRTRHVIDSRDRSKAAR